MVPDCHERNIPPRIANADVGTRSGWLDRRKKDYIAWDLCDIWPVQLGRCFCCFDIAVVQTQINHATEGWSVNELFCLDCRDWYNAHFEYWGAKGKVECKQPPSKGMVH
jgi:hypothetical protein